MAAFVGFQPNGSVPLRPNSNINEIEEYEKILRIRDQVFVGGHPRLTVPAHALRKVSPRLIEVPPVPVQSRVEFVPPAVVHASAEVPGLQTNKPVGEQTTTNNAAMLTRAVSLPRSHTPQPTASGIDPIFLTKSDELIRQETVFQRSRLEKQLREQFEKKKGDARKRPHPEEIKPEIDISAMLTKIMDAVKPLATARDSIPLNRASSSDSFDENSFYSSRAPDSTPEEGALSEHTPATKHQLQPRVSNNLDADDPADQRVLHGQQVENREPLQSVNARPTRVYHPNIPFPYDLRQDRGMLLGVDTIDLTSMDMDDDDEPEYSPPEPAEQYNTLENDQKSRFDYRDPRSRPLRRYSGVDQHEKRPGSPLEAGIRIVRSHITSPLAPQPSRVSPLAVAKVPPLSQNNHLRHDRDHQNGRRYDPNRHKPEYAAAPEHSRKKRKLDKKVRMKKRTGLMAASPEAQIKDEPVSPPPFHNVQPLGAPKPRTADSNMPIYIDDEAVQQVRYLPVQARLPQLPQRQMIYEEPPLPRSDPQPYSRASIRPTVKDHQDLRRVASLHNTQTERPTEYVEVSYNTPTRARTRLYAAHNNPHTAPSRSNQEPIYLDESQPAHQDRATGTPAPAYRMDPTLEVRYRTPEMLPREQKRLVQDQYGNQFYEVISHQSDALRQHPDVDPYNDQVYARNDRAGSVFVEPLREGRYIHDMLPPPQISYRRVDEVPRTPAIARGQLGNATRVIPSTSVPVVDYAPRPAIYTDERLTSQAAMSTRMGSARPQEPHYEEVRLPSNSNRDGSVFMDERPPIRRECIPLHAEQQPVYRKVVRNGQQYYEVQEPRYER